MRTLLVTILLTAAICSAQTPIGIFIIYPGTADTTISISAWYKADSTATYARGFAARPLIHDTIWVGDTSFSSQKIDAIYNMVVDATSAIAEQRIASSHDWIALDKLIAAIKQYNDPIIRNSMSASALATLIQSLPASTLIVAQSRNANGTTNLTYQTVKP